MKRKDFLFFLIKSLSRNEKRYLKINFKHSKPAAVYLQLFNAIDQQSEYDEAQLKVKFKGQKFIKHFHLSKRYLYRLILAALRNYHKEISPKAELNEILKNVEILYQKGLYALAETEAAKAEKIAEEYELETSRYDVLHWQRKLLQAQRPGDQARIGEMIAAKGRVLAQLNHIQDLWTELLRLPSPEEEVPKRSLQAKILVANVQYLNNVQGGRVGEAEQQLKDLLSELEQHPKRLRQDPGIWAANLNNLLGLLTFEKKNEEALALIQKAKAFYNELPQLDTPTIRLILRTYNIELELYRDQQAMEQAKAAIVDIQYFIDRQEGHVPPSYLLSFWFQFANLFFLENDYEQALHWINVVLNHNFKQVREDLQIYIRWLNLMVHLELKNYFVLRYYVGSMRRFIKARKTSLEPYEQLLLRFFTSTSSLGESDFKAAFSKLQLQLLEQKETLKKKRVLDYIDFLSWTARKL